MTLKIGSTVNLWKVCVILETVLQAIQLSRQGGGHGGSHGMGEGHGHSEGESLGLGGEPAPGLCWAMPYNSLHKGE